MDFIMWKIMDDLKGICTCMTCLREIVREATWIATVVAHTIQSCPVLNQDQICVVLCSSFLLSKGVSHGIFVLAPFSTPKL